MEKRIVIAALLSFLVLFGFRLLYPPTPPAQPQGTERPQAAENEKTAIEPPSQADRAIPVETDVQASAPEQYEFRTTLYTAVIDNAGGVLKSFRVHGYLDAQGESQELINQRLAEQVGWPFALATGDPEIDRLVNTGRYAGRRRGAAVTLDFATPTVHVRKTFRLDPARYRIELEVSVARDGEPVPYALVWQGGYGDQGVEPNASYRNAIYSAEGDFERINLGSVAESETIPATARVGVEDRYFAAMFLLPSDRAGITTGLVEVPTGEDEPARALTVTIPMTGAEKIAAYVGPKHEASLRQVDAQLASLIDYGIFEFITRPLLFILLWINNYIGNFGWSIILLTLLINFILFPLRWKQQVSMQKMQTIQPQMKTLQDKMKKLKSNDPRRQQVQTEMMGLYKQHGVNPLGGCLPLLLQMPVLFAFWNMLTYSIEMRRAPWILWVQDLSQHDPFFVLPILMAVSMIAMQKMTPTTLDPAQAKIMMAMPVMMTALFFFVQSGVVLYWLTSNVIGIGQQVLIKRNKLLPVDESPKPREHRQRSGRRERP